MVVLSQDFSGLGAGMGNTAIFVGLNAIVDPSHKAVAASGLFLSMPVGMISGIAVASAAMLQVMKTSLDEGLARLGLGLVERQEVRTLSIMRVSPNMC